MWYCKISPRSSHPSRQSRAEVLHPQRIRGTRNRNPVQDTCPKVWSFSTPLGVIESLSWQESSLRWEESWCGIARSRRDLAIPHCRGAASTANFRILRFTQQPGGDRVAPFKIAEPYRWWREIHLFLLKRKFSLGAVGYPRSLP